MYSTTDFRKGLKIEYEGLPYIIVESQHVKPGKGGAFVRTRIKNLINGNVLEPTFKSGDTVQKPDLEEREMEFQYKQDEDYMFMDLTSFEQIQINGNKVGENKDYLQEGIHVTCLFYKGSAIALDVPNSIVFTVVETEPGVRGNTATNATKAAKTETGAVFQVPMFVNEGDKIKVDTRTHAYLERG